MIKSLLFLIKYNIIKEPINLSLHLKEFNKLSSIDQRKVLDKYFNNLNENFNIDYYFNNKESFIYENGYEISFFNNYYFDISIIDNNIYNIRLIDKFNIDNNKINKIINNSLEIIKNIENFDISKLFIYPNELPNRLSSNINFMSYICSLDYHNIKYMTYNDFDRVNQNKLISSIINKTNDEKYNINNYMINKKIPKILLNNLDFVIYILSNDINNISYIDETLLDTLTDKELDKLINGIINTQINIKALLNNHNISKILFRNYKFIIYLIENNLDYIRYIDWHNIEDSKIDRIINKITILLESNNYDFDITNYLFKNIFYRNYNFMLYLVNKDIYNIKYTDIEDSNLNNNLINIFLNNISKKCNIKKLLSKDNYINKHLIENENMFKYLFRQNNNLVKYINFMDINKVSTVISYLIKEINSKNYEYNNDNFLVNNKYPIPLSNNYLFMKYVIDMNFNNLAYIDTTLIEESTLKKIINYACRMVYYIRGNNKQLNFDIEGYFKNSDIINNEYFQECLKSL